MFFGEVMKSMCAIGWKPVSWIGIVQGILDGETAWQEPQGELQVIPEATGSSAEARQCHQGYAIPKRGDECALC